MDKQNKTEHTLFIPKWQHIFWIFVFFAVFRLLYYWVSDGFSTKRIENTLPIHNEWALDPPKKNDLELIQKICEKPFTYLTKGSQSYAFLSTDKRYVLKLFKCHHLKPLTWLENLPLPTTFDSLKKRQIDKRNQRIRDTLTSFRLAANHLREECAIVFMQILPSNTFHQNVTLIDKIGRKHTVSLEQYGFIIQHKADLIYPRLLGWIKRQELDKAKKALESIVALIVSRSRKGIQDSDPDLHKNAGLIDTTAIMIDLGRFHYNEELKIPDVYKDDLKKITNNFSIWLKRNSEELYKYLKHLMHNPETLEWDRTAVKKLFSKQYSDEE